MATENPKVPDLPTELPFEAAGEVPAGEEPAGAAAMTRQMEKELQQESGEQVGDPGKADSLPASKSEHGGQTGPEPTRYGDWEKNGRCTDF